MATDGENNSRRARTDDWSSISGADSEASADRLALSWIARLEARVAALEADHDDLRAERDALEARRVELRERVETLERQRAALGRSVESLEAERDALEAELDGARAKRQRLVDRYEHLLAEARRSDPGDAGDGSLRETAARLFSR